MEDYKEDVITHKGTIGKSVCAYVQDRSTTDQEQLVVVGARELGFFERAFLGSVGEYLVNNCHCTLPALALTV